MGGMKMHHINMAGNRRIVKKVKGSYATYELVDRNKHWTFGDTLLIFTIGIAFYIVSLV